jgi:fructoselysine-6-P-deglycase FrlB-like protein
MSLPSIQSNLAAMINKAYSADASATTVAAAQSAEKAAAPAKDNKAKDNASASAQVTLGQSGNTTEIYTAQGLLQQMRQIQLSNSMMLFGNDEEANQDSSGLLGMMASDSLSASDSLNVSDSDSEQDAESANWAGEISNNPEKAAVMVEKAKNASLKTMLGG